jgi:hypothetical protein
VLSSQVGTASFFVSQRIILLAGGKRKETEWAHRKRNDPSLFVLVLQSYFQIDHYTTQPSAAAKLSLINQVRFVHVF